MRNQNTMTGLCNTSLKLEEKQINSSSTLFYFELPSVYNMANQKHNQSLVKFSCDASISSGFQLWQTNKQTKLPRYEDVMMM